jgi:L-amino acid N-acyltransferase
MKFKIRNYTKNDIDAILEIVNYNIVTSTSLYDYTVRTIEKQREIFEEKLLKGYPILVATIDKEIVGFGYYSEFRFREAYKYTVEHSVYVTNEYQGKGVGKLLINALITNAKIQKMHTMIGVIDSENKKSISFHKSLGFETVGIIKETGFKFNKWLDSVIMQIMLD